MAKSCNQTTTIGQFVVKGFLHDDEDCEDPFKSCDGMGKLVLFETRSDYERGCQACEADPLLLRIEKYEHSGVTYSLADEGYHCQFDTTSFAGYWAPDADLRAEFAKRSEANPDEALEWLRDFCRGVLETYNSWCSGDCWGIEVEVHNTSTNEHVEQESCWGFIGREYAEKELKRVFDDAVTAYSTMKRDGYHVVKKVVTTTMVEEHVLPFDVADTRQAAVELVRRGSSRPLKTVCNGAKETFEAVVDTFEVPEGYLAGQPRRVRDRT